VPVGDVDCLAWRRKKRKKETGKGWVLITRYVVMKEAGLTSFVDQSKKEWEL
jgi:hypothetical protein